MFNWKPKWPEYAVNTGGGNYKIRGFSRTSFYLHVFVCHNNLHSCQNRRNPAHRFEESHPGDDDYIIPIDEAPVGAPLCPFAVQGCYRRQPLHFKLFSHSLPSVPSKPSTSQNLLLPSGPLLPSRKYTV